MPLVCSKSVRCHTRKRPSLMGRNGSLDPITSRECNARQNAFARLMCKTVNFNCEHCLEHGQLAKDVSYFQRKSGLLGKQNTGYCLVLHGYPSFAMKRYSTVRWVFAVTALGWAVIAGRVNTPGSIQRWMSWVASAAHQGTVSQLVSACYYRRLPLCSLPAVKGLDLWLGLLWAFSYLDYAELVKPSEA